MNKYIHMNLIDDSNVVFPYNDRANRFWTRWDDREDREKYNLYQQQVQALIDLPVTVSPFKSAPEFRRVVLAAASVKRSSDTIMYYNQDRFANIMSLERWYHFCCESDAIGKPYLEMTPLGQTETANIKYMYHAVEILDQIKLLHKQDPAAEINIVEIGGGYGGLSYFINRVARQPAYNLTISSYTIFDLDVIMTLQGKVSDHYGLNISRGDLANVDNILSSNSYLISNYAYSELTADNKQVYMEKVFPYTPHGFMSWNVAPIDIKYFDGLPVDDIVVPGAEPFGHNDLRVIF